VYGILEMSLEWEGTLGSTKLLMGKSVGNGPFVKSRLICGCMFLLVCRLKVLIVSGNWNWLGRVDLLVAVLNRNILLQGCWLW
jgi:hypothetical protein